MNREPFFVHPSPNLYEDIKHIPGHIYEISFQYHHRPTVTTGLQAFKFTVDQKEIFNKSVTIDAWIPYVMLHTATKESERIEFEETGFADGIGVLIDDVVINDLGSNSGN